MLELHQREFAPGDGRAQAGEHLQFDQVVFVSCNLNFIRRSLAQMQADIQRILQGALRGAPLHEGMFLIIENGFC